MRVIGIGGEPATGKTTLMRRLMQRRGIGERPSKSGKVKYHRTAEGEQPVLIVLGDYRDAVFGGTDKLSMSVQPDAITFMRGMHEQMLADVVLFEGDRLMNGKFCSFVEELTDDFHWLLLEASEKTLARRQKRRGSSQGETWRRGRKTKVANLRKQLTRLKVFGERQATEAACLLLELTE